MSLVYIFENKTKVDSHAGVRNHCQADHFPNFRNPMAPQNDSKSIHQTQALALEVDRKEN